MMALNLEVTVLQESMRYCKLHTIHLLPRRTCTKHMEELTEILFYVYRN